MGCCASVTSIPRLILVNSNSNLKCRFNINEVYEGSSTSLTLTSHPGLAVVPFWKTPKQYHKWNYIDLGIGPESEAIKVRFDGKFIVRSDDPNPSNQKVFDVSMWRYREGNHLVIVSGFGLGQTRKSGGGRDFNFNSDGTISPSCATHLRLGMEYVPTIPVKTPQDPYAPIEGTENGPKLVLVKLESSMKCVIERHSDLRSGARFVPLNLSSHPGQAIVARYASPRQFGEWSYLELGIGPTSMAMEVRLQDEFIFREHDGRVFDVAFWKYEEGNHLSIVGGNNESRTRLKGGGRSFRINSDGTVSCVAAPQFVLGTSIPSLILVNSNSDLQCRFNLNEVYTGSSTSLTLTSHPGLAVVPHWKNPRQWHEWNYIDLGIGPESEAIKVRFDGKFIVRSDDPNPSNQKVFDVSMWQYREGNHLVIVSGPDLGQTRKSGGGRDFDFNFDGTISPTHAKHLRLGMTYVPTLNPDIVVERGEPSAPRPQENLLVNGTNGKTSVPVATAVPVDMNAAQTSLFAQAVAVRSCGECGVALDESFNYCANCGTNVFS